MNRERSISEQIVLVERKLDLRRQRTTRHWQETRSSVSALTEHLPLLGAVAALGLGLAAGRRAPPSARTSATVRKTGLLATLVAIAGTVFKFGMSPAGRALWATLRNSRFGSHSGSSSGARSAPRR